MGVASGEGETGDAFAGGWGAVRETVIAFAGARRGVHETRDAFAGRKWPGIGRFVRAKVSVVSTVCGKELAEVPAVSYRGSEPPALVSSVSGKVVGRCCESALATSARKNSPSRQKSRFWGVLHALGELFRAWVLMEASRANLFALVWPGRG